MAKSASEATRQSEARRGIRSTSFKFNPDEMEILNQAAEIMGGRKAAVVAGLQKIVARGHISKQDVIAWLEAMDE